MTVVISEIALQPHSHMKGVVRLCRRCLSVTLQRFTDDYINSQLSLFVSSSSSGNNVWKPNLQTLVVNAHTEYCLCKVTSYLCDEGSFQTNSLNNQLFLNNYQFCSFCIFKCMMLLLSQPVLLPIIASH